VQQTIAQGKTQQEVLAANVTAPMTQEFLVDSCVLVRGRAPTGLSTKCIRN
jgi:hypothetical protein